MASTAHRQNNDRDPDTNRSTENKPADADLPTRYLHDDTVACMVFSEYSSEAKAAFEQVKDKVKRWLGERASHEDAGRAFSMSMTLFLNPAQRQDLTDSLKDTSLQFGTVKEFVEAMERGIRDEEPRVDTSDRGRVFSRLDDAVNAGHAFRELSSGTEHPWEKQKSLALDVWNGMIQLQNFAASMLQSVQSEITSDLIDHAEDLNELSGDASAVEAAEDGIYTEAAKLTRQFAEQSAHLKEVQDAMVPLARALLSQSSPILKEIAIIQLDSTMNLLGRGLGLYETDPEPMLQTLEDWKAFFDTQIPLLSQYFNETAAEKSREEPDGEPGSKQRGSESEWRATSHFHGDKTSLTPYKWSETVFQELRSEHLWGLTYIGVPGPIGDRAFEIVNDLLARADAEAKASRPAYAQTLIDRELMSIPNLDKVSSEFLPAFEEYKDKIREAKLEEANQLIHTVTDSMISALPWMLPKKSMPLPADPELHLERTLNLIERYLEPAKSEPGHASNARGAAQELAIQLEAWDYLNILDENPDLAARTKKLFEDARVSLPKDWCTKLRERGIL